MLKKQIKVSEMFLLLTIISIAVSSISLSFIPLASKNGGDGLSFSGYVIAVMFWLGLITALIAAFLTKNALKVCRDKLIREKLLKEQRLPGIINFSLKKENIVIYVIFTLGFVLIITDIIFSYIPEMIMFPIISLTILLFSVHSVMDGKNFKVYKLIKESAKREKNHKQ